MSTVSMYPIQKSAQDSITPRYFKSTFASLSYREIWRFSPWWAVPITLTMKLFRSRMVLSEGAPEPLHLDHSRVAPSEIPDEMRSALDVMVESIRPLGFGAPVYYSQPTSLLAGITGFGALCLHDNGETFANVLTVKSTAGLKSAGAFVTLYSDGSSFTSVNDKAQMLTAPHDKHCYYPGKKLADVFPLHEKGRRGTSMKRSIRRGANLSQIGDALLDYEKSGHDWHVTRGAYVPMSAGEVEAARRKAVIASPDDHSPLEELSFSAQLMSETEPEEMPKGLTFSGAAVAEAVRAVTKAESSWSFSLATSAGTSSLALDLKMSLRKSQPGASCVANLQNDWGSKRAPLLAALVRLLGVSAPVNVPKIGKLAPTITLLSRDESVPALKTKEAGEHILRLEIPGVAGGFELRLHPAVREARLKPEPDLDRQAAMLILAGLLS